MTVSIPQTRQSLLLRIKNPHDRVAWKEFDAIYRPAVYRFARRRGLQPEDADDVTQHVLVVLMGKISEWNIEQDGSFAAWLLTVARNAITNKLRRKPPDAGRGGTSVLQQLSNTLDESDDSALQWELWRAAFRWAASEVRPEFQQTTWQAFWNTAVQRQSSASVADELGLSVGAVYTAKSRVMKRLRDVIQELELNNQ